MISELTYINMQPEIKLIIMHTITEIVAVVVTVTVKTHLCDIGTQGVHVRVRP
jgi:hypothetical protein